MDIRYQIRLSGRSQARNILRYGYVAKRKDLYEIRNSFKKRYDLIICSQLEYFLFLHFSLSHRWNFRLSTLLLLNTARIVPSRSLKGRWTFWSKLSKEHYSEGNLGDFLLYASFQHGNTFLCKLSKSSASRILRASSAFNFLLPRSSTL